MMDLTAALEKVAERLSSSKDAWSFVTTGHAWDLRNPCGLVDPIVPSAMATPATHRPHFPLERVPRHPRSP
jgi:sulfite exporter TauE/SafE